MLLHGGGIGVESCLCGRVGECEVVISEVQIHGCLWFLMRTGMYIVACDASCPASATLSVRGRFVGPVRFAS